jgi:hypothetical protein
MTRSSCSTACARQSQLVLTAKRGRPLDGTQTGSPSRLPEPPARCRAPPDRLTRPRSVASPGWCRPRRVRDQGRSRVHRVGRELTSNNRCRCSPHVGNRTVIELGKLTSAFPGDFRAQSGCPGTAVLALYQAAASSQSVSDRPDCDPPYSGACAGAGGAHAQPPSTRPLPRRPPGRQKRFSASGRARRRPTTAPLGTPAPTATRSGGMAGRRTGIVVRKPQPSVVVQAVQARRTARRFRAGSRLTMPVSSFGNEACSDEGPAVRGVASHIRHPQSQNALDVRAPTDINVGGRLPVERLGRRHRCRARRR